MTFTGTFTTKEFINAFITPLKDLLNVGMEKLVLEIREKTIFINSINKFNTVISKFSYEPELFSSFTIGQDFEFGINDLSEFVSVLDIFKSDYTITIDPKKLTINSNDNSFDYYGCEVNKITRPRKGNLDDSVKFICSYEWDKDSFSPFVRAMSKLNQEYIIFNGSDKNDNVIVAITDKDIRTNTFSFTKPVETIEKSFKIIVMKQFLASVVSSSIQDFNVEIAEQIILFKGSTELHKASYYIATAK